MIEQAKGTQALQPESVKIRPEFPSMEQHWATITGAGRAALTDIITGLQDYSHGQLRLNGRRPNDLLLETVGTLEDQYRGALDLSLTLSVRALAGERTYPGRSRWFNEDMDEMQQRVGETFSPHHLASVLDGIVVASHRAGLKELVGPYEELEDSSQLIVHDTLMSATSVNLGPGFPYAAAVPLMESLMGIEGNMCLAYHAGVHQVFGAEKLKEMYPQTNPAAKDVKVIAESSGTAINSMAIEAVVAYAEQFHGQLAKWLGHDIHGLGIMDEGQKAEALRNARSKMVSEIVTNHPELEGVVDAENPTVKDLHILEAAGHVDMPKVLAINGTWCGGYGTAAEGTGFGVAQHAELLGTRWVDRSLPLPTHENREEFLRLLKEKIASGQVAGLILEPNIIGDAGIINTDPDLLREIVAIMNKGDHGHSLPIIADCIQQGSGRTGQYFGFEGKNYAALRDYPLLITTTAKSASNGQPFGFALMPQPIVDAAYPLSMITTNAGNGATLRAVLVANFVNRPEIQKIIDRNAQVMEQVANKYGLTLRGMRMNRGINAGSPDAAEYLQLALLLQDGILTGGLPAAVRFQPMLLEHPQTIYNLMHVVCRRIKALETPESIPAFIIDAFNRSSSSGLNFRNDEE